MIVYWSQTQSVDPLSTITTGIRTHKPILVTSINDKMFKDQLYQRCPAYSNYIKNLFYVSAPLDYNLTIKGNQCTSTYYDQHFFERVVEVRDIYSKLFSLALYNDFVPECDSLEISQIPAHLHKNNFIDNTILIPGTFNIGKWPRTLSPSFHVITNNVSFNEGDPLYYVKFHTNEKIIFKEYISTDKILFLKKKLVDSNLYKNKFFNMDYYYNLISKKPRFKKMILDEIVKNLVE